MSTSEKRKQRQKKQAVLLFSMDELPQSFLTMPPPIVQPAVVPNFGTQCHITYKPDGKKTESCLDIGAIFRSTDSIADDKEMSDVHLGDQNPSGSRFLIQIRWMAEWQMRRRGTHLRESTWKNFKWRCSVFNLRRPAQSILATLGRICCTSGSAHRQ